MKKIFSLMAILISTTLLSACDLFEEFDPNNSSNTDINNNNNDDDPNNNDDDTSSKEPTTDPYVNVDKTKFYSSYKRASSYKDAIYRSKHYLMSGEITNNSAQPVVNTARRLENKKYLCNTSSSLSNDKLSYTIFDVNGNYLNTIYKGGAYINLDEVAAYVYAFGDIPANYLAEKDKSKIDDDDEHKNWGKYLRLNHSYFSGDTNNFKYEPKLPELNKYKYYEMDIGVTSSYTGEDGRNNRAYCSDDDCLHINRGTCRIVYTKCLYNNSNITNISDKYVFYTYNHYNDFQQYLNYKGGWGERFGNVTGGGTIDNDTNKYVTPYPEVVKKDFK